MSKERSQSIDRLTTIDGNEDDVRFIIVWCADNHWADFKVYRAEEGRFTGKDKTLTPFFQPLDIVPGQSWDMTPDIDKANPYLEGFIKWDGCSEMQFSDHLCGATGFYHHMAVLEFIYKRAAFVMGRDTLNEPWGRTGPTLAMIPRD